MVRMIAVSACLGSLLLASTTSAICDDVENGIGIYFDADYNYNCLEGFIPFLPFSVYFVLNHGTLPTLVGFEMSWRLNPTDVPHYILSVEMPGAIDWSGDYEWLVGYGVPRPVSDSLLLVRLQMMIITTQQPNYYYYFQVGPTNPASIAGRASIAGGDPLQILPLEFCNDWPQEWAEITTDPDGWSFPGLAAFAYPEMCYGGVSVESASWSAIKALYN